MRLLRRWRTLLLLAVLAWLVTDAVLVFMAYGDAMEGRDSLEASRGNVTVEGLRSGATDGQIRLASQRLSRAHDRLDDALVKPLHLMPFVGRQLTSASDLTGSAGKVSRVAVDSLAQARDLSSKVKDDRAGTLLKLSGVIGRAHAEVATLDLGPDHDLIGPLARSRNRLSSEVTDLRTTLDRASAGASGIAQLFSEDGNYLVIVANNAEMRSGSGMFLGVGALKAGGGNIHLGDMETVGDSTVPPQAVPWPKDIADRWGFIGYTSDFRNLMMSARFDQSAPLAAKIWEESGNPKVDGVLVIDPIMLKAVLASTGPVQAGGKTITSDNVLDELFVEQYRSINLNTSTVAAQAARREGLSMVANEAFEKLNAGEWEPVVLARELGKAAEGRHVLLWSEDPQRNALWQRAGIGGTLDGNSMMLSLVNVGANKIDQYLTVNSSVVVTTEGAGLGFTITTNVQNTSPSDAPGYVLGPAPGSGLARAEYSGLLDFTLPGDSSNVKLDGKDPLLSYGAEGPNQVIAANIRIAAHQNKTFVLHFVRPATARFTAIEPSARVPASTWHFGASTWQDDHRHVIRH